MRTTQIVVRSGLAGLTATAAALPLMLAAPWASAQGTGITVTSSGSTVRVLTEACPEGGMASLLSSGQAIFAQGRQATLTEADGSQTASWSDVVPGSHTVIVMCGDGTTAGAGTVTVASTATISATATPSASVSPAPTVTASPTPAASASTALGVRGGLGGATKDYGSLTLAVGGSLVAAAVAGGSWYLRRRRAQRRF